MKTVRIILGVLLYLLYFVIDVNAQIESDKEIRDIKTVQEGEKHSEFAAFDALNGRFGLGVGVLNANTDFGRYGSSFFLDLMVGCALYKFELYSSFFFGRGKTNNDIKYLNETWAAGSRHASSSLEFGMKYRLFEFGKIGISPDIGYSMLDVQPITSDLGEYPGLRKFRSDDNFIYLGFSISYLLPTKSKLSVVSLDYAHYSFATKSYNYKDERYANNLLRNSNKLTLRIILSSDLPENYRY